MKEFELYSYLKILMPEGMQFVAPYLDKMPLPKRGTDWAQMTVLSVTPKAWAQERQTSFNAETSSVGIAYDQNNIYRVQFDFYGDEAFENAVIFKQNLQVNLVRDKTAPIHLGVIGTIKNLTFLEESKTFLRRYGFEAEFFVVDSIHQEHWVINKAPVSYTVVK